MFSKSLEGSLNLAFRNAREKHQEFITIEHLLLALLDDTEVSSMLMACGANLDRLRTGLGIFVDETTPRVLTNREYDVQPTLSFQRVLQRAIYQTKTAGYSEVTGSSMLLAIFGENDSQGVYFLNQEQISRADILRFIAQDIKKQHPEEPYTASDACLEASSPHEDSKKTNLLAAYTVNLNEQARLGKLDPLIGRQAELTRCIQVLCRRSKNNPLFIGEAGVGKTVLVEGLAQKIVDKEVPESLANMTIYSLDLGNLLAGTKYRGDFEKRFKSVLKALSNQEGSSIFIDEIHNLVGTGSATGGTMDAANLIKPLLSTGELKCLGATTYEEFRNCVAKDSALLRRFQTIDVPEPDVDESVQIIKGLIGQFEAHHGMHYSAQAIQRAVELSSRYLLDRHLPDKAIDVIDEAGASQQLLPSDQRCTRIDIHHIEKVLAKMARIPIQSISQSDKDRLQHLATRLKKVIFGQDAAIHILSDALKLSRSGLQDQDKPVGSFLLAGPTGVGKTELIRQLAHHLEVKLIRLDMSEYMEKHTVSRLIGSPPGYVGYEQGGLLTEAIIKHPYAVLLLDEIEKAHPDIFNLLLQVMDYGKLTDNNGREADFHHVIVTMTTNVGADRLEKNAIGFSANNQELDSLPAIHQLFAPEFRNRLDAVLQFAHLDQACILKIVDKHMGQLEQVLKKKGYGLYVSKKAKKWLARQGFNHKMGARPMERIIQEHVKKPIAEELLFGTPAQTQATIHVDVQKEALIVQSHKHSATSHSALMEPLH